MTLQTDAATLNNELHHDAEFADALEQISEHELVSLLRKHCEKSWQATRWLLELKRPERYAKGKKNTPSGPSATEVLAAVMGVVSQEISDGALRARLKTRLDALASGEMADAPRRSAPLQAGDEESTVAIVEPAAEPPRPEQASDLKPRQQPACADAGQPCLGNAAPLAPAKPASCSPSGGAASSVLDRAPGRAASSKQGAEIERHNKFP